MSRHCISHGQFGQRIMGKWKSEGVFQAMTKGYDVIENETLIAEIGSLAPKAYAVATCAAFFLLYYYFQLNEPPTLSGKRYQSVNRIRALIVPVINSFKKV